MSDQGYVTSGNIERACSEGFCQQIRFKQNDLHKISKSRTSSMPLRGIIFILTNACEPMPDCHSFIQMSKTIMAYEYLSKDLNWTVTCRIIQFDYWIYLNFRIIQHMNIEGKLWKHVDSKKMAPSESCEEETHLAALTPNVVTGASAVLVLFESLFFLVLFPATQKGNTYLQRPLTGEVLILFSFAIPPPRVLCIISLKCIASSRISYGFASHCDHDISLFSQFLSWHYTSFSFCHEWWATNESCST